MWGTETSMCGCLLHAPYWGPGLKPRHVPWLGIEPATSGSQAGTQSLEPHQSGMTLYDLKCFQHIPPWETRVWRKGKPLSSSLRDPRQIKIRNHNFLKNKVHNSPHPDAPSFQLTVLGMQVDVLMDTAKLWNRGWKSIKQKMPTWILAVFFFMKHFPGCCTLLIRLRSS